MHANAPLDTTNTKKQPKITRYKKKQKKGICGSGSLYFNCKLSEES